MFFFKTNFLFANNSKLPKSCKTKTGQRTLKKFTQIHLLSTFYYISFNICALYVYLHIHDNFSELFDGMLHIIMSLTPEYFSVFFLRRMFYYIVIVQLLSTKFTLIKYFYLNYCSYFNFVSWPKIALFSPFPTGCRLWSNIAFSCYSSLV